MNYNGALAERYAANYLRKKKYKLLDYNFQSRFGEIDLIVQKKNIIAFVEVKERNINSIALPREFVDFQKQRKIIKTAELYLSVKKLELQPRFDVIEIITEKDKIKSVKHLENAFTLD